MEEFNKIFYDQEVEKPIKEQKQPLKKEVQPHGMGLINFTLTEHMLDEKVQEAAQEAVLKNKKLMEKEILKKTKDLRTYMNE